MRAAQVKKVCALWWRPWQLQGRARVWRGRDDPTGELSPRLEVVTPLLTGPIDNMQPRILPRRTVDNMIKEEYAELHIGEIWDRIGVMRCTPYRYNINKYKLHYRARVYPPVYSMAFKDPTLPLTVDVGSGCGWMIILMAKRNPNMNFLGLEKRSKRVEIAQRFVKELGLTNVHFVLCNASLSFETLMATYPGSLQLVMIVCPDPHIRKKYLKIRMVRKTLVNQILRCLAPGGKIFMQSEFQDVAEYMREYFDSHVGDYLSVVDDENTDVYDEDGWLLMNPLGVRTDVEIDVVAHGEQIYRRYYERLDKVFAPHIPYWATLPPPDIEFPLELEPKKFRPILTSKLKGYGRRKCRMVRRLNVPAADIILNGECYPKSYFQAILKGPQFKYKYRTQARLRALTRPLDPTVIKLKKRRPRPSKKPLGVYEGWREICKM